MDQIEMVSLESLVPENHLYRTFNNIWSFKNTAKKLKKFETNNPHKGYGMLKLFKCLLLQFMENISDRELERFLQENNAAKWFCGFSLVEKTPNYSVFSRARQRIGTKVLAKIFSDLRDQLKAQGLMNEVFSFIDASALIAKAQLWEERDEAIKQKYEKLNNEVLPKVAKDTQARIGCKSKNKYWYGFKKHVCVDMQSGLINKVAITRANLTDGKGLSHVCPSSGAIYADKAYCVKSARHASEGQGCHLAAQNKTKQSLYSL